MKKVYLRRGDLPECDEWYWPGEQGHPAPEGWYHNFGDRMVGPFETIQEMQIDQLIRAEILPHLDQKAFHGIRGGNIVMMFCPDVTAEEDQVVMVGRPVNVVNDFAPMKEYHSVVLSSSQKVYRYLGGELAQDAFKNVNIDDREFLISGIWAPGDAWDQMLSDQADEWADADDFEF